MSGTRSNEDTGRRSAAVSEVETIAWLMDNSIPVPGFGGRRIGLDGILGFVPILGDALGAGMGLFIVWRAVRLGVPGVAVARMLVIYAIDLAVGAIPLVGDAFDLWFKANTRNLRIMRRYLEEPAASTRGEWVLLLASVGAAVLALGLVIWLIVAAVSTLIGPLL